MLLGGLGEAALDLIDQSLHRGLLAERLADHRGVGLPGPEVEGAVGAVGDGRGDGQQPLVVLGVHAGVGADNQVRIQRGDPLELEAVGGVQDLGPAVTQLVLGPGPGGEGVAAVPLGDPDGDDPHREHRVLLAHADGDHPLGRLADRRGPVRVRHRDREGTAAAALRALASVVVGATSKKRKTQPGRDERRHGAPPPPAPAEDPHSASWSPCDRPMGGTANS